VTQFRNFSSFGNVGRKNRVCFDSLLALRSSSRGGNLDFLIRSDTTDSNGTWKRARRDNPPIVLPAWRSLSLSLSLSLRPLLVLLCCRENFVREMTRHIAGDVEARARLRAGKRRGEFIHFRREKSCRVSRRRVGDRIASLVCSAKFSSKLLNPNCETTTIVVAESSQRCDREIPRMDRSVSECAL